MVFAALRSSETASATTGIGVIRTKLILFAASSFFAGLGGGLLAMTIGRATTTTFNLLVGVVWIAIVVTWGVRSVVGALLAGIIFAVIPQQLSLILVLIAVMIVAGLIVRLIITKSIRTPIGAISGVMLLIGGIFIVRWLLDIEVSESWVDVPTMLFGLGAIGLAREPQGLVADTINRFRLRRIRTEARLLNTQSQVGT
jgi:ABC-type branched-subunit amino acid transport system permease subunit